MRQLVYVLLSVLLLAACTTSEKKEAKARDNYLVEEQLQTYALSAVDSVYSVKVVLQSATNVTLAYIAQLEQNGIIHKDSLIFDITANQPVNGQLIFSACVVEPGNTPTLNSKIKVLE